MKMQKWCHKECKCMKQQCMSPVIDAVRKQISLRRDPREGGLQSNNSVLMFFLHVCTILHLIKVSASHYSRWGVEAYNTPLLLDPDFYEPTSTKSVKQQSWLNAEHLKYTIAAVSLEGDSNIRFFGCGVRQ